MAEKKNTITRAQAIEFAIGGVEHARSLWETDADWPSEKSDEIIAVLKKMHEQLVKPRAKAVSKARKGNEALAKWVYDHAGDVVTTKDVVAMGKPEIATTQKAAAVLRVACEMGLFTKGDGKKVAYAKVYGE